MPSNVTLLRMSNSQVQQPDIKVVLAVSNDHIQTKRQNILAAALNENPKLYYNTLRILNHHSCLFEKNIRDKFATQKKLNIPQVQRMAPLKDDDGFQVQRISWLRWPFQVKHSKKKTPLGWYLANFIILTSLDFPKIARNLPFPLTKKNHHQLWGAQKII